MRMVCFKFFPMQEELAKVKEEYSRFSSCSEEFNDPDSIHDRWAVSPMTWWTNHGQSAPLLMSLAMNCLANQPHLLAVKETGAPIALSIVSREMP